MSWFSDVKLANPIEVFALTHAYQTDTYPQKVNLGVGAYRSEEDKPWVLPVVRTVESQMAADQSLNHEYLPVAGSADYRDAGVRLLLGAQSPAILECRADGVQSLGGTGALRMGLDFLTSRLNMDTVYVSNPTWGNHKGISNSLKYKNVREYRYWDEVNRNFDLKGMLEDLENAPERSVILLHMCAHNPTGMDPTQDQWKLIAEVIKKKNLFPFFDCAYQGFSTGNLEKDAWSLRYFIEQGFEILAAQSFSKNFGLYNQRVGNLIVVSNQSEVMMKIKSQLEIICRTCWSNPPAHGSRIIASVLNNPALFSEWKDNVETMATRILYMRKLLHEKLRTLGVEGDWSHIVTQSGMFSYTGLNPRQVSHIKDNYHIYMLKTGRISMSGITTKNVEHVAAAIADAVKNIK